jgi:hypothetical protein
MFDATPVAKRKPAIGKTDVPKAAVNLPNAHGNTPLNSRPVRRTASNNVTTSPKPALGQSVIDRATYVASLIIA